MSPAAAAVPSRVRVRKILIVTPVADRDTGHSRRGSGPVPEYTGRVPGTGLRPTVRVRLNHREGNPPAELRVPLRLREHAKRRPPCQLRSGYPALNHSVG